MRIVLNLRDTESVKAVTPERWKAYEEIIGALIESGGLSGIKNGQTIIHFDHESTFMGIQFSYWPWKRRKAV